MGNHHSAHEYREKHGKRVVMDRLRRSLRESFRRKKDHVPECSKPHQWQSDEAAVRSGTCNFLVKYLGCVEVFESRGMQVCEEALKVLRNSRRRPTRGTLYVTGDGLRVVDDETKGLIVDQTIEKVSFCAPDRNHEKGFSYICRDGTTRRWMCHGFLALKDSGERLSHAVGCAFAVCLERKQKRDKETVMMNFDPKTNSFTRTGSFGQSSLTERMQDPQECKPADPPPVKPVHNPFAIERPHATPMMLQRQGSFRGFTTLNQTSPFKRQLSLRVNDLPSNVERQRSLSLESSDLYSRPNGPSVTPIPESSPVTEKQDTISAMCQQLSQGLNLLANNDDPFMTGEKVGPQQTSQPQPLGPIQQTYQSTGLKEESWNSASQDDDSKAESWLASSATNTSRHPHEVLQGQLPPSPPLTKSSSNPTQLLTNQMQAGTSVGPVPISAPPQPTVPPRHSSPNFSHLRSQSLGSSKAFSMPVSGSVSSSKGIYNLGHQSNSPHHNMQTVSPASNVWANGNTYQSSQIAPQNYNDPFDAEWVALAKRQQPNTNPFTQNSVKAFEVHM